MSTAVRIQTLDNSDPPAVVGNIDFLRYEIVDEQVVPADGESVEQESQSGAPTLFLLKDAWNIVNIRVRIHGATTEAKLTTIRNFIRAGGIVRVYPKWYADQSYYFDCYIKPEDIPINFLFSGQHRANNIVNLIFRETGQSSQYVVSEDIVIS